MKVRKLLTLLVVTAVLAGCNTKSNKGDSSSENKPSASSESSLSTSEFSSESSLQPDISSSSSQGDSSSSSSSSDASIPSDSSSSSSDASSGTSSSSSSSMPAANLVSITVTPPTKIAYDNHDTALDLTGMVVTANYDDTTSKAITAGYTVSEPNFSQLGPQEVTVTYQGFTDKFTITVSEWVQTEWDSQMAAFFAANLCGYVPPYFDDEAMGYGELEWSYNSADNDAVFAEGNELAEPAENDPSPLKPLADIYIAAGFVASVTPNPKDEKNPTYHYTMDKEIEYQGAARYLRLRLAMTDSEGIFSKSGKFYYELMDAYTYSWEDSGFEAAIKSNLDFIDDIPDFQNGARFLKTDKNYFAKTAPSKYVTFTLYGASADYANAYLEALDTAGWDVFGATREEYDAEAISPDEKARMAFKYNSTNNELKVYIDESPIRPDNVKRVAAIYNVSPFAFSYSDESEWFFYQFNEETLQDGEDWGTLIDKYAAILTADAGSNFVKKGERTKQATSWYDKYVDAELGIMVVIFGYDAKTAGKYGVQISVEDYVDIPDVFLPAIELLGIDPNDVNMVPATATDAEYAVKQIKFDKSKPYAEALKEYTDILDADTSLELEVISPLRDATMQSGEAAKHIEYANNRGADSIRLMFLAWTSAVEYEKDPTTGEPTSVVAKDSETIVQVVFYHYTPAPTSEWLTKVLGILNDAVSKDNQLENKADDVVSWDDEDVSFNMSDYRPLAGGLKPETLDNVVSKYANKIINKSDELGGIETLLSVKSDSTDQYPEAKVILFSSNGSIEIKYGQGYGDKDHINAKIPVLFITVRSYDPASNSYANGVSALTGATLALNESDGTFVGMGSLRFSATYSLVSYGSPILTYYVAADLTASSLGFTEKSKGMEGNDYVGYYENNKGYKVKVVLIGDANKNYTGNYKIILTLPQA